MSLAEAGNRECIWAASVKHPVMDMKKAVEHILCPKVVMYDCRAHETWPGTLIWAVAADAGKRGDSSQPSKDWPERQLRPCAAGVAQAP